MKNFLSTILTIWQREVIRYSRDKARILSILFQPLLFLLIFGTGLRQTIAQSTLGIDYIQFMYPGIIAMSIMGTAFFSTISTVWDREFGFLKEILVAPVPRSAIALGKSLGATSIASFQALILLTLSPLVNLKLNFGSLPSFILFIILLGFAISGLGLFIASLMKTTESFGLIIQLLVFPMFFLSGAFFPLTAVPYWMSVLAKIDPLTYGVDAFRQIILINQIPSQIVSQITLYSIPTNALFLIIFSSFTVISAVIAFNKKT